MFYVLSNTIPNIASWSFHCVWGTAPGSKFSAALTCWFLVLKVVPPSGFVLAQRENKLDEVGQKNPRHLDVHSASP